VPDPLPADLGEQVAAALREDIGAGDVSAALVAASQQVHGRVITREAAVLCGCAWAQETFRRLDPQVRLTWHASDGAQLAPGQLLFEIAGPARPVLTGERTALNFLQLLSATATAARRFVDAVAGTGCRILDTRKTVPGLRSAQKYAVRCGGACNHRQGLYDLVLIKENHIAAAGSIGAAIATARTASSGLRIEVEAEDLDQLRQAVEAHADVVLLDNFELEQLRAAVAFNRAHLHPVLLECSGGVTLENVRRLAETGVDFISVGALTKHVQAVDLSMRILAARA
jgi:nicotinate-nucleotide pyrophosphorylase (carboxylating)